MIVRIGDVPHVALRCGAAAAAPFEERIGLWRERLGAVAGNAHAIASVIPEDELHPDYIIPSVFDRGVAPAVAAAVARAAEETGVAHRRRSVASP